MKKFAIAIHGGAESIRPQELDKEKEAQYRKGLSEALKAGYDVLEKGGSAVDAVEAAVNSMEDNPLFNAGHGASLTQRGETEFDAAIMDGNTLRVGAVALDINGNLAAATSTGGLTDQMRGRVGDTPIIGGGTYADNGVCAVSCTGEGEVIMRGVLAHELSAMMKYAGLPLQSAADKAVVLHEDKLQGDKGILAMDPEGNAAFAFNTGFMKRGYWEADGAPFVALWENEKKAKAK